MTTHDHDTDPSTPGAKRPTDAPAAAEASGAVVEGTSSGRDPVTARATGPSPPPPGRVPTRKSSRGRPTTDPGVAPPPQPLPVPQGPMGIIVPSVASDGTPPAPEESLLVLEDDDSVDVLLEGIAREQPEWPRTAPQPPVDGQPTAAHAALHVNPPPPAVRNHEPKVVIDPASLGQTIRVERSVVANVDPREWTETTAATAQSLVPRVVIAVIAGLVVVMVIFVALRRTSRERAAEVIETTAPVQPTAAAAAPSVAAPLATATESPASAPPVGSEVASGAPGPSAGSANAGSRKASPPGKATTRPRQRSLAAPKPSGADLGEFKGSL